MGAYRTRAEAALTKLEELGEGDVEADAMALVIKAITLAVLDIGDEVAKLRDEVAKARRVK